MTRFDRVRALPPDFVGGYLFRGVLLWFAIHFAAGFLGLLILYPLQSAFLVLMVYVAAAAETKGRRDGPLLGNLGVPGWVPPGLSALAALLLEGSLGFASGLW